MFHVYLTVAYLYVLWRFVMPLPISRGWRVSLALALLVISKYHLILIGIYGNMFSPECPRWMVLVAGWLFCSFVFVLVITLVVDLLCVIATPWLRLPIARLFGWRGRSAIAVIAFGISAFGVYQAAQVPAVRHVEFTIKDLPQSLEGLRVVQLTDLHISRLFQSEWVKEVVASTNALNPDLILVTGDVIDGTVEARSNDVAPLASLTAPMGVVAIPGNHEYYFDCKRWLTELEHLGMHVLVNDHVTLTRNLASLLIAGVSDESAPDFGLEAPNLTRALEGVSDGSPIVLLKHRPVGAAQSASAGVSLQLSGHTHGGMVRGLDLVASLANQSHVSGAYKVAGMDLYVSNGTALWNGFPIRLGVPAEITEIVLHAGAPR
ncbi:metallophosphoesterase [Pseudomonas syringae]|nr:metallophosphoesterase [Pseudomonas syringae]